MNKRFTLFTEKSIFCHKIDCLRVLLNEFTVLRGTFVLLLNMHMYIDMIFFLFINLRKRLTIMNFELMRWMKFLTVQYLWFIYLYQCWQYVSIFQPKYMLPFCCYESILYWLSLLEGYVLIKAILKNHSMFYCPTFTLSEPRFSHYLNLRIHRIAPYIGRF